MLAIQISMIVAMILPILGNPQNKVKVRNTMLMIYRAIKTAYPTDSEF